MEEKQMSVDEVGKEKYLENQKSVWFEKFGPAKKRSAKTWKKLVRLFGAELVIEVEGMTADQLQKKCGFTSFSKQLSEKFRQQRLNG